MLWVVVFLSVLSSTVVAEKIDRFALVNRHNVNIDEVHAFSPLSVGNGRFAFTADVTGLQSFPEAYAEGIPLTTMAESLVARTGGVSKMTIRSGSWFAIC